MHAGGSVSEYILDHHQQGERQRLELMSRLLDPMHRHLIERLGIGPGARTLEVGCGNGSMSAWLAGRVVPGGHAVAVDLDLSLTGGDVPGLELRQADIVAAAETALYNGGSPWAVYWTETVAELRRRLVASGKLDDSLVDAFLARHADPAWWTRAIAFTAVHGRKAAAS